MIITVFGANMFYCHSICATNLCTILLMLTPCMISHCLHSVIVSRLHQKTHFVPVYHTCSEHATMSSLYNSQVDYCPKVYYKTALYCTQFHYVFVDEYFRITKFNFVSTCSLCNCSSLTYTHTHTHKHLQASIQLKRLT